MDEVYGLSLSHRWCAHVRGGEYLLDPEMECMHESRRSYVTTFQKMEKSACRWGVTVKMMCEVDERYS